MSQDGDLTVFLFCIYLYIDFYRRAKLIIVNLGQWLNKRKIKQSQLARKLNRCNMSVHRWVHGETFPSIPDALQISQILRCKIEDIWKIK